MTHTTESMANAEKIAAGVKWIDSFTIRHVLSRPIVPIMSFEMTTSERAAAQRACSSGLAWRFAFFWGLTTLGQQVREILRRQS